MNKEKTILILGAGVFQVAAIKKAVQLGYHVITLDYLPDNIGHRYSHGFIDASTTDLPAVLDAARQKRIDGIFTMASDIALPALARVAAELGLQGPGEQPVRVMTQKNRFRPLQAGLGLDTPQYLEAQVFEQALAAWPGGPAMIKPAVSSGSRGVIRVERFDSAARSAFEAASDFSFNGQVCVESVVKGHDVAVEGFVLDGMVQYLYITEKHTRTFSVLGHTMPNPESSQWEPAIREQVQAVVSGVGYEYGPFDADFRVSENRVVLLEITPRLGGNGMPILVETSHGIPLVDWAIRQAMGDLPSAPAITEAFEIRSAMSVLLYSEKPGKVRALADPSQMYERLSGVSDVCIHLSEGAPVERFEHGGHVFGYCVLDCPPGTTFNEVAGSVHDALALDIE